LSNNTLIGVGHDIAFSKNVITQSKKLCFTCFFFQSLPTVHVEVKNEQDRVQRATIMPCEIKEHATLFKLHLINDNFPMMACQKEQWWLLAVC
jgi:hypothetical protein